MSDTPNSPSVQPSFSYRNLRALFVVGFALDAAMVFVPSFRMKVGGFMGMGGEERSLSVLDAIRLAFANGQFGIGMFFVLCFCAAVAFAVLAVKFPRRWVFVAGSCFAAFMTVLSIFMGSGDDAHTHRYLLPRLIGYVCAVLQLVGFWVRPPIEPAPTALGSKYDV